MVAVLPPTRQQLGVAFPDQRTRQAFEDLFSQALAMNPDLALVNFVVTAPDANAPNAHVITAGAGISVTSGSGLVTVALTGGAVTSFSAGGTGLTPSSPTGGAILLGGTLAIGSGGTGQTTKAAGFNALSPITTAGDLIVGSGVNAATRLAVGANGTVLKVVAGAPTWVASGSGGYLSSTVLAGAAVALTTGTPANITSLPLTAGDWDVEGLPWTVIGGGTTMIAMEAWISTTSATAPVRPNGGGDAQVAGISLTGSNIGFSTGTKRITVATTATVFLSTSATFSGGALSAYGFLRATPVT